MTIWEKYVYSFHQELPLDWDIDPRYRKPSTVAWAHTEEVKLSYDRELTRRQVLRGDVRNYFPVQTSESLVLEYDWLKKESLNP